MSKSKEMKIVERWAKKKAEDLADSIQWYLIDEGIRIDIKPLTRATIKAFHSLIGVLNETASKE